MRRLFWRVPGWRWMLSPGMAVLAAVLLTSPAMAAVVVRAPIEPGVFAAIKNARSITLQCVPPTGAEGEAFAKKYIADPALWKMYEGRQQVAIPYSQLSPEGQRTVLLALFPEDAVTEEGWRHVVQFSGPDGSETIWQLSQWLTGDGNNARIVVKSGRSQTTQDTLQRGQQILVPRALLLPAFQALTPERAKPSTRSAKLKAPRPEIEPEVELPPPVDAPKTEKPESVKPAKTSTPKEAAQAESGKKTGLEETDETEKPAEAETDADAATDDEPEEPESETAADAGDATESTGPGEPENAAAASDDEPEVDLEAVTRDLSFGKDKQGLYAMYTLKSGEALYTAVAVRFTDFSGHADVLKACETIQQRSGIKDVRHIPAGQKVLIPLDLLADRFHPAGSEQRKEYEEGLAEASRLKKDQVKSHQLEGVVVILDPGHGGRDHGAENAKFHLYEDELNYDIMCRAKRLLETKTRAKVFVTMRDPNQEYESTDKSKFVHDTDERVLTTPEYPSDDAGFSVNLRWYLANAIYRREKAAGADPRRMIFISIHADALFNGKLRGAMVYIPGARYRRDSEQPSGAYDKYKEAREQRRVSSTAAERKRDEALSRNFAESLLKALGNHKPPILRHKAGDPIRAQIRQSGGRVYVPSVLRNTQVPAKVLIETANMTNPIDCTRLADPKWRESFAESIVDALNDYFGG